MFFVEEIRYRASERALLSKSCGGVLPNTGSLWTAYNFKKKRAEEIKWTDNVAQSTSDMMKNALERVRVEDPVKGSWNMPEIKRGLFGVTQVAL